MSPSIERKCNYFFLGIGFFSMYAHHVNIFQPYFQTKISPKKFHLAILLVVGLNVSGAALRFIYLNVRITKQNEFIT